MGAIFVVKVTYSLREYNEAASHSTAFYAMADAVTDQVLQQAEVVGLGDIARQRSDGVKEAFVFELLAFSLNSSILSNPTQLLEAPVSKINSPLTPLISAFMVRC